MSWKVAESHPLKDVDPAELRDKWVNVAMDMALIPENNIRVYIEDGIVRIEVSEELYNCMAGI
ncbi:MULTISPECIES: hypothetical protein [Maridesulfovibrio]|mgnify:CR=1 FL=1|uniref:Uncharacterized protein n=1 Tax=Maridesulfovibrio salexigens (strain ATCC 14822 / DSM 2638 / NCIMB 8403 / VKM B-1763) TaxID=526222 RepID=C6BY92_MARSD|nr:MULTISPECIES: hypothetical protein [Maridesulfovibrio]ACS78683.1 hypothetical protein Desal_0617 [Maridesulfovibrio salexigens DSM 2638]